MIVRGMALPAHLLTEPLTCTQMGNFASAPPVMLPPVTSESNAVREERHLEIYHAPVVVSRFNAFLKRFRKAISSPFVDDLRQATLRNKCRGDVALKPKSLSFGHLPPLDRFERHPQGKYGNMA